MSEKRRDSKGRLLRTGEQQRKDGRYIYGYKDSTGKMKYEYSWKLEPTDKLPTGVRDCVSLREKEKEIQKALAEKVAYHGGELTVLQLVEKYLNTKNGVRDNTMTGYKFVLNILREEEFGSRRIDEVKLSEAKEWLVKLQKIDGRGYSSIKTIRGVVRPAFQMAFEDELLVRNPFQFELKNVIVNDSVTREAITHEQKRKFLEFVRNDKHFCKYYDAIYILFHTGMRISEFCGLTIGDINLKKKNVSIVKQLHRTHDMRYVVLDTKTDASNRVIPINDDVCQCFKNILANRKKPKVEPMVDGYSGFLFYDKEDKPTVALHWEKYFQHIVAKYNRIYKVQMPEITPHVCRHTYCSHCAGAGMNPKTLQYLMGHSDISVTLNVYTHVDMDNVVSEVKKLGSA